jgi:hypothetical protein
MVASPKVVEATVALGLRAEQTRRVVASSSSEARSACHVYVYNPRVRSGQVGSGQVRSGQVRSGQARSGRVRSGQVVVRVQGWYLVDEHHVGGLDLSEKQLDHSGLWGER